MSNSSLFGIEFDLIWGVDFIEIDPFDEDSGIFRVSLLISSVRQMINRSYIADVTGRFLEVVQVKRWMS